jgi:hypothetical protein
MREVLFQVDLTNRTAAEAEDVDIFDAGLYKRLGLLIGLDMRAFTKCLNTNRHHAEVPPVPKADTDREREREDLVGSHGRCWKGPTFLKYQSSRSSITEAGIKEKAPHPNLTVQRRQA